MEGVMDEKVIEGLICLRKQARQLGSEEAAQALERTLFGDGIELKDGDGWTQWRRVSVSRGDISLVSAMHEPDDIQISGNVVRDADHQEPGPWQRLAC
jgi:hypothetical protein